MFYGRDEGQPCTIAPDVAEIARQIKGVVFSAGATWVRPHYDAVGFAVRNLGFVKFQVLDRLVTEIELHPRNVDVGAPRGLERLLDTCEHDWRPHDRTMSSAAMGA